VDALICPPRVAPQRNQNLLNEPSDCSSDLIGVRPAAHLLRGSAMSRSPADEPGRGEALLHQLAHGPIPTLSDFPAMLF
jgi:hypothetical protein